MDRENKKISEEFGLSSESEAVKEYLCLNRDVMYSNYPLIADEIIMKSNQEKRCILDIGTGLGSLAREFAKRLPACRVYGIDISGEMLAEAHRINTSEDISNLTLMLSDINHMAFEGNAFDGIVSFGVLHHLSTLRKAFSEIRRVLKERGEAFLYDLRKDPPQEVVAEIADGMSLSHKRAFLESVREGLDVSYIEAIVQGLGFTRYSLSYPTFSRATVVKNKSILQASRFLGKRFNQLLIMIYLQK
jgi:ubiquinone/menaquinone biosynthesis C-methylase UbiE